MKIVVHNGNFHADEVFAVAIIFLFVGPSIEGYAVADPDSIGKSSKNCREVQVPYEEVEEYQETVPYTEEECESKDLAYNIENFVLNYNTCNEKKKECESGFMGIPYDCIEYCVDRTISCSLDLRHLDNEEQGS